MWFGMKAMRIRRDGSFVAIGMPHGDLNHEHGAPLRRATPYTQ
jgi:hypothetical protein